MRARRPHPAQDPRASLRGLPERAKMMRDASVMRLSDSRTRTCDLPAPRSG
jgi:hypothetical protein